MNPLSPREERPDIASIDYEALWKGGIRGLLFDLDNTLCPWHAPALGERELRLLKELRERGFRICVLSNGTPRGRERLVAQLAKLGIPILFRARKPLPVGFKRALGCLKLPNREVAAIGDQIFTDILGGNLLGLHTILVDPLDPREHPWTRLFSRNLERLLGRRIRR